MLLLHFVGVHALVHHVGSIFVLIDSPALQRFWRTGADRHIFSAEEDGDKHQCVEKSIGAPVRRAWEKMQTNFTFIQVTPMSEND